MLDENKAKEQSIVLQKWKENNFIGTYEGFTGVGKTRIGTIAACEFIKRDSNEKSLIVTVKEDLRDITWEESIKKWGYIRQRDNVEIQCIQTAYKFVGRHYNTIVIDEWHGTLGPCFRMLLKNNTYDRLLCLTATIDDNPEKLAFTQEVAPIIWSTPRDRAVSLKLVSPSRIYNMSVDLTDIERKRYDQTDEQFKLFEAALGGPFSAFNKSAKFLRFKSIKADGSNIRVYIPASKFIYDSEIDGVTITDDMCRLLTNDEFELLKLRMHQSREYWKHMRQRRNICINAFNKIAVAADIIKRYPDRKGIVFAASIAIAEDTKKLIGNGCTIYHSKLKSTEALTNLRDFIDGKYTTISSVKALNEGTDVPECSLGVSTGGDGKKLTAIQRNGRISRFIEGKISYFVNLYAKNTQERVWINKATSHMNPKWIESIDELPLD